MKRFFFILMIIIICVPFTACGENKAIIGTWETDITVVGENIPNGDHFVFMSFKLNGKCSYSYCVNDTEISRTDIEYTATESQIILRVEGREMVCDYAVNGNEMTLTYNGNTQVLIRTDR